MGKRSHCVITKEQEHVIESRHDGFGKECRRRIEMKKSCFIVEDWYDGEAVSYIHLAEGSDERRVKVEGAINIVIKPWKYSVEYNKFLEGRVIEVSFNGHCNYTII